MTGAWRAREAGPPRKPVPAAALILAGLGLVGSIAAQVPDPSSGTVVDRLDDSIPALLERHRVPGFALGVVEGGRVTFARGYGCADCQAGREMTDRTVLNAASLSKPVTAWGVLRLARQQNLDLDAPVEGWLPTWPLLPSPFDRNGVTLRRLLSHTAGLSMPSVPWFPVDSTLPTRRAVIRGEGGEADPLELVRSPGSGWAYSGGGYLLLEQLVEEISGRPFPRYMRTEVLRPLGMRDATFDADAVPPGRMAVPYDEDGAAIEPYRVVGVAAGGLHATVRDLAHFLTAYSESPGLQRGRGVLPPEEVGAMLEPVAPVELEDVETGGATYAMGHNVHEADGAPRIVFHSGGNPGFLAYILVVPSTGDGIALLCNSARGVPVIAEVLALWAADRGIEAPPLY